MTELADLVEAYKREVAVPGTFAVTFPNTTDLDIEGALGDAFAEAQLAGFFGTMTIDVDAASITPDLSVAGAALVVIYAGIRLLRQQITSSATSSTVRYWAGPVGMQTGSAASTLTEAMKALEARRKELLDNAVYGHGSPVFMIEGYQSRGALHNHYGGFLPYESAGNSVWLG